MTEPVNNPDSQRPRIRCIARISCIDWTITDRCNYNCLHCFHAADNTMQRNEFSYEDAMRFLDEIAECGIPEVRLTGGEPTIYPYFREVVKGIRERGLKLKTLITNGSKLDEDLLGFLKENQPDAEIMISFDGIGCHDWLRQHKGSEEEAVNAIRASIAAGFPVAINTNVNRKNRDVMFPSFCMLAELGVERCRIIRTTEAPRWELNQENFTLTPEEYYDFSCEFAEQYKKARYPVPVIIWQSLYLNKWRESFSCLAMACTPDEFSENAFLCNAVFEKISVQPNGEMAPCSPFGGYNALHGIHMGNVIMGKLKNLLTEGPLVDAITHTVGEKLRANKKCGTCRFAKLCLGGCPALSILSGGSMLSSDLSKCIFFENGYYDRFRQTLSGWRSLN